MAMRHGKKTHVVATRSPADWHLDHEERDSVARAIRHRLANAKDLTHTEIALEFGVSDKTVRRQKRKLEERREKLRGTAEGFTRC